MKKLLLLSALLLGLGSPIAAAAGTTPVVINDSTKVSVSGTTAGNLAGQVVLQTGANASVTYNVTTGGFTDASGKAATLNDDQRRALTADAKQALTQAVKQAQAGSYGESSPAILAALVKTLIALDPARASTYTNFALTGLLGPSTGLTDKGSAITLITSTATDAVSDSNLSASAKTSALASIDQAGATMLTIVSNPATDVVPLNPVSIDAAEPIQPVNPDTISNGSGNSNGNG